MSGKFNLLHQNLITPIIDAAYAAGKLIEVVTPENSVAVIEIGEAFGLGISDEIKSKSEAMEVAQMEADEMEKKLAIMQADQDQAAA